MAIITFFGYVKYLTVTEAEAEQEKDLKLKTRLDNLSDEEGQILQDEKFSKIGQSPERKVDTTTDMRHYTDELSKSRFLHWFIFHRVYWYMSSSDQVFTS